MKQLARCAPSITQFHPVIFSGALKQQNRQSAVDRLVIK
jgi:hypothetical protein